MYLAKEKIKGRNHYSIRQSYRNGDRYQYRELFSLGEDPARYIHYPGGNAYYYDPDMIDTLERFGLEDQDDLDDLFWDFLDSRIRRVIDAFDKKHRRKGHREQPKQYSPPVHLFDKRRFHYLRYGHSAQRYITSVPEKYFRPLQNKSRDEIEQYFLKEERKLTYRETAPYVAVIFNLLAFRPDSQQDQPIGVQMDRFFMTRLCRLNSDRHVWAGSPGIEGLQPHLIRYAVMYFDFELPSPFIERSAFEDFMNRHRRYSPPQKVRENMQEAVRLFGISWRELKQMDAAALSRLFRKLAMKHHPDKGGDPTLFRKLARHYASLKKQKDNVNRYKGETHYHERKS